MVVCFLLISLIGSPLKPITYFARAAEKAERNLWNPNKWQRCYFLIRSDVLKQSPPPKKIKHFLQLISNQFGLISSVLHIRFSEIWAISNSVRVVRSREHMAQWITSIDHILLKDTASEIPVVGVCGMKQHADTAKICLFSDLSGVWNPTPSTMSLALVPGMLNPVTYHPLLTRASLDNQTKTKICIFGHFHLQASARVSADDWTILELKEDMKIWPNL